MERIEHNRAAVGMSERRQKAGSITLQTLDSGAVYHFARDRPLTPLPRTNQLARLGHPVGTSILDGPWYKLTPNSPFQTSPQARISLDGNPDYYYDYMTLGGDPAGLITWTVPLEKAPLSLTRVGQFTFDASSLSGLSLASIALQFCAAYPGKTGQIVVIAGGRQAVFEIDDVDAARTLDIIYQPQFRAGEPANFELHFGGYISFVTFECFTFGPTLPVVYPVSAT